MKKKRNYIAFLTVSLLMSGVLSGCGNSMVSVGTSEVKTTSEPIQNLKEQEPEPTEMVEATTEPIIEETKQTLSERVGGKLYIGDEFTFGTYEQDNDLENGAEDIEWIVLEKTGKDTYLCISKYVLDAQPFHNESKNGCDDAGMPCNDWGISSIRTWLNNDFFNTAFTSEDQGNITDTVNRVYVWQSIKDNDLSSKSYSDKVCLINYGQLDEFPGCVKVTEYAKAQGASVEDDGTREHENCSKKWWLMSMNVDSVRESIEYHQKFVEDYNASHWWSWEQADEYDSGPAHYGYSAVEGSRGTTLAVATYGHTVYLNGRPDEVVGVRPVITIKLGN